MMMMLFCCGRFLLLIIAIISCISVVVVDGFVVVRRASNPTTVSSSAAPSSSASSASASTLRFTPASHYYNNHDDQQSRRKSIITYSSASSNTGESTSGASDSSADDDYKWPDNLYLEVRDMAAVSFLVYAFAYATDVARKEYGLRGIKQTSDGHLEKDEVSKEEETKWKNNNKRTMIFTPSESSKKFNFPRSFTPTEILSIIDRNREVLAKYYKSWFSTDSNEYKLVIKNLQTMQGM